MDIERDDDWKFRDTGAMQILTGRPAAAIRKWCTREDRGYDSQTSGAALKDAPDPILLTAVEAETYLGLKASRVRQWASRERLRPLDWDWLGHPRYDLADLQRLADGG